MYNKSASSYKPLPPFLKNNHAPFNYPEGPVGVLYYMQRERLGPRAVRHCVYPLDLPFTESYPKSYQDSCEDNKFVVR